MERNLDVLSPSSRHWVFDTFIGGLFFSLSFLVLPWWFVLGYFVETVEAGGEPVRWDHLGVKFKKGAGLFVVIIGYALPFALLYSIIFETFYESLPMLVVFFVIYGLLYAFFYPAMIIILAREGLGQAFNLSKVWRYTADNLSDITWIVAVELLSLPIALSGLLVIVLFPFTLFYALASDARLFGLLAREKDGKSP